MLSTDGPRGGGIERTLPAIVFLVLHAPLGLLMQQSSGVATVHALAILVVGMWLAVFGELPQVAIVGAYIVGAEVLWRMSDAHVFWEFGKYATAAIFAVALLRRRLYAGATLPLLYFLLLLPSTALTLLHLDTAEAVGQMSFNLSGPFALMMSVWFFSYMKLPAEQLRRLFLIMMGPIVGIGTLALSSALAVVPGQFTTESTSATSGGFGPNQVSAVLGLGALAALFYALDGDARRVLRALASILLAAFLFQGALTFSRGGVLGVVGAILLGLPFLLRDSRIRRATVVLSVLLAMAIGIVLPRLDAFTGGALASRFEDVNSTGRDVLVQADLLIWSQHPVFGAGPGLSREQREAFSDNLSSIPHTEFSRMLADHGVLGLLAAALLMGMALQNVRRAKTPRARGLAASMTGWSLLFMLHSATRLVAPAFTFGLASAALFADETAPDLFRLDTVSPAADAPARPAGG